MRRLAPVIPGVAILDIVSPGKPIGWDSAFGDERHAFVPSASLRLADRFGTDSIAPIMTRILQKHGFVQTGTAQDDDEGLVWRWELPLPINVR